MEKRVRPQMAAEGEAVFLEAMRGGWAAGHGRDNRTTFEKGSWRAEDQWVVGNGGHSAGWTMQFLYNEPFWQMHYQGRYDKRAIPFLKRALMHTYTRNIFFVGRGPALYEEENAIGLLRYEMRADTRPRSGEVFDGYDDFSGIEKVWLVQHDELNEHPFKNPLGFHRVQGMRLRFV